MSEHKAADCWEQRQSLITNMLSGCKEALGSVHADCWDLQFYRSSMGQKYETALIDTQVEKQKKRIEEARRLAAQVRAQTEVALEYGKANITVFEATQSADRFTVITATRTEAEAHKA